MRSTLDDIGKYVKREMMIKFDAISLKEGRKIVKESGIQLLPKLKIIDVIAFDSIMKDMRLKNPKRGVDVSTYGMYYSEDLVVMATCFISSPHLGQPLGEDSGIKGNIILHRFEDTKLTQSTMNLQEHVTYFITWWEKHKRSMNSHKKSTIMCMHHMNEGLRRMLACKTRSIH